ncbi:MAG TPA: hypothetical protein VNR61_10380 [Niallia sp.]|nr:hypothetical protein [Niallia sp.]
MENVIEKIDYSNYFWQDDKVRLRSIQPEDWEGDYISKFDTPARRLLNVLLSCLQPFQVLKSLQRKMLILFQQMEE